jgi:hypothetical protein
MRILSVAWLLLLLPNLAQACDVCGIFLGIQPHDRTSSVSLLYRYRQLEGDLLSTTSKMAAPKHGGHGVAGVPLTGNDHYQELYQVVELRADIWLSDRIAVLASVPAVNNYRAVNGYISSDIYGMGDPLVIGRYLVANTKCLTEEERIVHRLMLGSGVKLPLGRTDVRYQDALVAVDQQPGTGSWDLLATMEYMVRHGRNGAALNMVGRYNGSNADDYQLGHGLSTTAEVFRRWDFGEHVKFMPSLGLYHELSGKDAENDVVVQGTGSSTLFTHVGSRVWWRSWMLSATFQYAVAYETGDLMVPNKMRFVTGITYNLIKN